jgi:3-oxoisoapionate kinase
VTAGQIAHAEANGFTSIPLDAARAVSENAWGDEIGRAADAALQVLGEGRDPLVYTARGPDDAAVAAVNEAVRASGVTSGIVNDRIGTGLGLLLDRVMRRANLTRGVIAGGDTAGHAAQSMGICALTALAPIAPGSGLSLAHTDDAARPTFEIALKGGQIGAPNFFCAAKRGIAA